jgi:hypothetical protein
MGFLNRKFAHLSKLALANPNLSFDICGWSSLAIYAVLAVYYCRTYTFVTRVSMTSGLIVTTAVVLLLLAYLSNYAILRRSAIRPRRIVMFAAAASIIALCIPNVDTTDVFTYISYGWQQSHCHINPYVRSIFMTPGFGTDSMLMPFWATYPFPYGFTFAHITRVIAQLGGGSMAFSVFLFKLLCWSTYAGLSAAVYFGAKRLGLRRPALSLYLFAFSPFVLLQAVTNAHNDLLMTFPVMLGMMCLFANAFILAAPLVVLGGLVKLLWLLAIPFLCIYAARMGGRKALAQFVVAAIVTAGLLAASYVGDWRQFQFDVTNISDARSSLFATTKECGAMVSRSLFHNNAGVTGVFDGLAALVRYTMMFALGGCLIANLYRSVRMPGFLSADRLISICVFTTTAFICLINTQFFCWYQLMVFPMALWLPEDSQLRRICVYLSAAATLGMTFVGHSRVVGFLFMIAAPFLIASIQAKRQSRPRELPDAGETSRPELQATTAS